MLTNQKLIICHNHFELYTYEKPLRFGDSKTSSSSNPKPKNNKEENRMLSFQRSKRTLRRLINSNAYTRYSDDNTPYSFKFLTLTNAKNITDIKISNYEFKKFTQRLSYHLFGKENELMYACAIEFQKRGSIHYHVVLFNVPYIEAKELQKIWRHGSIDIEKIEDIENVGSYISKYMSKDFGDKRLCGQKAYFTSRNLEKPKIFLDWKRIPQIIDFFPTESKKYEKKFHNDFVGKGLYQLFDLSKYPEKRQNALDIMKI